MFAGPILTKLVGNQPKSQGLGRLKYGELVQNLKDRLDDLVALLGDDPFFYSDSPSAADFAIFGVMCTGNYGATPDFEEEIVRKPELVAWRERMKQAIEH